MLLTDSFLYFNIFLLFLLSENNVQEELFDQILRGKLEFPSPDWDTISLPAKVPVTHTVNRKYVVRWSVYMMGKCEIKAYQSAQKQPIGLLGIWVTIPEDIIICDV